MRLLITLRIDPTIPVEVRIPGHPPFQSDSHMLAKPNFPHLDDDLRYLIMQCTAADMADRPSLKTIADILSYNITTKTGQWYADRNFPFANMETDETILQLMNYLFFTLEANK